MVLNLPGIGKDEGMLLGPSGSSSRRQRGEEGEVVFIRQPRSEAIIVALDGTGDTDDIQEGINMAPAGGGTVRIKEGIFTVNADITITKNNLRIIGAGKGTKIQTVASGVSIMVAVGISNLLISDIYFYGSGGGAINSWGISFSGCNHVTITNCRFENCTLDALRLFGGGANYNIISNNKFISNHDTALSIESGTYTALLGNQFIDNKDIGIHLLNTSHTAVQGNLITNSTDTGMKLEGATYCSVLNNISNGSERHGIVLQGASNNVIKGNTCFENDSENSASRDGIILTSNSDNNVIEGNRCSENDRYEINISDNTCDKNIIIGNNCIGTDHVGAINDAGTNTHPNGASGTNNLALDDLNIIA